jgi:hypothetical protein
MIRYGAVIAPESLYRDGEALAVDGGEHAVLRHGDRLTMLLEIGGSLLTEHDPPPASSRCAISNPNTFAETPTVSSNAPTA